MHASPTSILTAAGMESPKVTVPPSSLWASRLLLQTGAGQHLHGVTLTEEDLDIETHLVESSGEFLRAHAAWESSGKDVDHVEMLFWLHEQKRAMESRRQAVKDALEAEIMRRIEQGAAYFASDEAQELGRATRA